MESVWFNCLHPRPDAKIRLILIPWCGGGSQVYARWGADMGKFIEVVAVRYPGRESRADEPFMTDLDELVKIIGDEIVRCYKDKPFALFGHSMGTVVSFEVCDYLKRFHATEPKYVFFSGEHAPHSQANKDWLKQTPIHEWSDDDIIDKIRSYGGTPKSLLDNRDFMVNTFIPPYKADVRLVAKYARDFSSPPLTCPISFLDGKKDVPHNIEDFKDLTTGKFQQLVLPGGHFYLLKEENTRKIKDHIKRSLAKYL